MHNHESLYNILQQVLGTGYRLRNNEIKFFCPTCNHHKKKLQVNTSTGKAHCWVCNFSAHTIPQLLRKLNVDPKLVREASKLTGEYRSYSQDKKKTEWNVSLPKEFKPLWKKNSSLIYKHSLSHLYSRNLNMRHVIKYGMGYCEEGPYNNRIIVPSYDSKGSLNYFIARDIFPNSKMKYKNPPMSKNVVIFELMINWNKPLVLVEGAFDAIAVARNSIPLLGKVPSKELIKRIVREKVKEIYIALDDDARQDALKLVEFFKQFGIQTSLVNIENKDPSEMGMKKFWEIANNSQPSNFSDFIKGRLNA